jgi:hypothetical protein
MGLVKMMARVGGMAVVAVGLSGCVVAGWSSTGGGFVWPGGLGLVVIVLLVVFFFGRARR